MPICDSCGEDRGHRRFSGNERKKGKPVCKECKKKRGNRDKNTGNDGASEAVVNACKYEKDGKDGTLQTSNNQSDLNLTFPPPLAPHPPRRLAPASLLLFVRGHAFTPHNQQQRQQAQRRVKRYFRSSRQWGTSTCSAVT